MHATDAKTVNKASLGPLEPAFNTVSEEAKSYAYCFAAISESLDLPETWIMASATAALLEMRPELHADLARLVRPESLLMATKVKCLPQPHLIAIEALQSHDPRQEEALRQMYLSLIDDIRIVPLLLARPMASLRAFRDVQRDVAAQQVQEIFVLHAPLANRFGIWQLKWQLEDLAFRLKFPEAYREIAEALAERREARENRTRAIKIQINELLERAGINATVSGRPKHLYSIWRKMQRKDCTIESLYDLLGFRIIVSDVRACYTALGVVHARWRHIPEEFDDYVAAPKGNLYRSIHTVVVPETGRAIEIQIRTHDMHREAELGVAAHWQYKEQITARSSAGQDIAKLRQMLDEAAAPWPTHLPQTTVQALGDKRIYALTPQGRVIALAPGATPVDFAYAVHTELGHHTVGSKVDGRLVPLTHKLRSGETVAILTRNNAQPSPDWMRREAGYVVTSNGRRKLRSWFRTHSGDNTNAPESTAVHARRALDPTPPPDPKRQHRNQAYPVVEGISGLSVSIASCCLPCPDDPIGALLTRRRGIRIHSKLCRHFRANVSYRPDHILRASWSNQR